jgi:hypothetical protein
MAAAPINDMQGLPVMHARWVLAAPLATKAVPLLAHGTRLALVLEDAWAMQRVTATKTAQENFVQSARAACTMKMGLALDHATSKRPVMVTVGAKETLHVAASTDGSDRRATCVLQDALAAIATAHAQMIFRAMDMVYAGVTDLAFAILDLAVLPV